VLVLDKISDKKINLYVVGGFFAIIVLFTAIRLIPFLTADEYKRASQFVGVPIPRSATEVKFADQGTFYGGDYLVSAKISRSNFLSIATSLSMSNRADLLTIWPQAFESKVPWWNPTPINDTNTYFADRPKEYSRVLARYENGTLYFKRDVPKKEKP
jgi:hypothetical protein